MDEARTAGGSIGLHEVRDVTGGPVKVPLGPRNPEPITYVVPESYQDGTLDLIGLFQA